jgi:hypothetical protein
MCMHQDLRLFGYYIHDTDGFRKAEAQVKEEMSQRKPDKFSPSGYAPDPAFQKQVSEFHTGFRSLADDLLTRAKAGKKVTNDEIVTLERAEKLYASASAPGPGVAEHKLSLLEAGRNAFSGHGMSDSRMVRKLSGLDVDSERFASVRVSVDHGYRQ